MFRQVTAGDPTQANFYLDARVSQPGQTPASLVLTSSAPGIQGKSLLQQADDLDRQANDADAKAQALVNKAKSPSGGVQGVLGLLEAKKLRAQAQHYRQQAGQLRAQARETHGPLQISPPVPVSSPGLKELYDRGKLFFSQKRYIEAAGVFEQALPLAKDKNIPVVLAALGDSYGLAAYMETQPDLRAQYLYKALENYRKALSLDPENALLRTKYDKLSAVIKPPATPKSDYRKELTTTNPAQVENVDQPPVTRSGVSHGYALVIASENYLPPLPPVPFAGADAIVVKRYFIQAFGIPEEHVKGLADPTLGQMRVGVNWLMNQARSDGSNQTVLYVYYAGHGVGDVKTKSPYLLPIDADPSDVAETGLSLKEMASSLGTLRARSFLLIDACFSGAASRARAGEAAGLIRGARPAYLEVDMPENPNVIIFSASTGQQLSNMLEPARHGLFTYYLLSGLHGRAADVNGQVTLRSLYGYVHAQVQTAAQRMNREQEPTLSPRLEMLGDTAGMHLVTLAR
jgi:tetratricopeptide (TPR) repeat protein